MANFIIEFTPFEANSNAQIITTATVKNPDTGEIYWSEQVMIDVTCDTTAEQVYNAVKYKTSGFAARVEAIELARQFVGQIPQV